MAEKTYPLITVKAVGEEDGKVVLFERNASHPQTVRKVERNGRTVEVKGHNEVFVARDGKEVEVAETPRVAELIGQGELQRVNWNSKQPAQPKPKEEEPKKPVV